MQVYANASFWVFTTVIVVTAVIFRVLIFYNGFCFFGKAHHHLWRPPTMNVIRSVLTIDQASHSFSQTVYSFEINKQTLMNWKFIKQSHTSGYTGCNRRKGPDFGRVFLMLNYTEKPQNTYIQSWTVWEIMASEVWNFDGCYTLTDYQIRIETGRNMWFL